MKAAGLGNRKKKAKARHKKKKAGFPNRKSSDTNEDRPYFCFLLFKNILIIFRCASVRKFRVCWIFTPTYRTGLLLEVAGSGTTGTGHSRAGDRVCVTLAFSALGMEICGF